MANFIVRNRQVKTAPAGSDEDREGSKKTRRCPVRDEQIRAQNGS